MKTKLILLASITSIIFCAAPGVHAQWVRVSDGMPTNIYFNTFATLGPDLFAGVKDWDSGVYRFDDKSGKWSQINNGIPTGGSSRMVQTFDTSGSNLYVGTATGIFLSTDQGASWSDISSNLGIAPIWGIAIKGSTLFASVYYGTKSTPAGVYLSTDNGGSWTATNNNDFPVEPAISELCVSGTSILACVEPGGIYISSDDGANWKSNNPAGTGHPNSAILYQLSKGILTDFYSGSVFLSTDDGVSWLPSFNGPEGGSRYLEVSENLLLAGTGNSGVYSSTNGGSTWSPANEGLDDAAIMALAVSGGFVYASSYYGQGSMAADQGVWRRPLSDFTTASVAQAPSTTFELSPNPTSGIVMVHNAPAESHVSVLNMLGQTVLEIANPGSADFTLDLSPLPPGAYCIRLVSPDASVTKMIVRE